MSETLSADDDRHIDRLYDSFVRLRALDARSAGRVEAWVKALMEQVREMDGQAAAMKARLAAQSRQLRLLEAENEALRERAAAADPEGRGG